MVQAVVPSREHVQAQLFIAGEHQAAQRYLPVTGEDQVIGGPLVANESVAKVCFTGGLAGGRRIMAMAAQTLSRVTLELGGNDPVLILDDAVLDDDRAPFGGFRSSGMGREFGIDGVREFMDTRSVTTAATRPASA